MVADPRSAPVDAESQGRDVRHDHGGAEDTELGWRDERRTNRELAAWIAVPGAGCQAKGDR